MSSIVEQSNAGITGSPDQKGSVTKQQILDQLKDWLSYSESSDSETKFRTEAKEDYQFYAGKQDTDAVKQALADLKRPATVFNQVKPKIDMLIGLGAQMRLDPHVVPVGREDEPLAELMNDTLRFYNEKLEVGDKEVDALEHTIKSGRSLLHYYLDDENPFDPDIKCMVIKGTRCYLDPDALTSNLNEDHRFIFVDKWLTEDEVKRRWPGIDVERLKQSDGVHSANLTFWESNTKRIRIVEGWYKKLVTVMWFRNPVTNKPEFLNEKDWTAYVTALKEGIDLGNGEVIQMDEAPESVKRTRFETHFGLFTGDVLLDHGKSILGDEVGFPFVLFVAYRNDDEDRWFSVINTMKDPQRSKNTIKRQLVHLLNTSPKPLVITEAGNIVNDEEYQTDSSKPNFVLIVSDIEKTKVQGQPQISSIYQSLDADFGQEIKDASGVQDSLMGIQTSSREPGVSVRMRQEQGIAVLFTLYNNFRKSRIYAGRMLMRLIQGFVSEGKVIRIGGPKAVKFLDINTQMDPNQAGFNDISGGQFDLVVDEEVQSTTMRMATMQMLVDFNQSSPGMIPPWTLLEYSNLPFSAKEEIKAHFKQQQEREERMVRDKGGGA